MLLCLSKNLLWAQEPKNIQGVFLDSATSAPLPFVHLQIKNTGRGTVASQDGRFIIPLEEVQPDDTLLISSIGYEVLQLSIQEALTQDTLYLQEATTMLDPVVVAALTPREIVEKSIRHIPENYSQPAYQLLGFYRTASKECGTYVRLLEGAAAVNDSGFTTGHDFRVSYDHINQQEDFRKYKIAEKDPLKTALTFDHVSMQKGFLNPDNLDSWRYELTGYQPYEDENVYVISTTYIADKSIVNHQATVYISNKTYAIVKVIFDYNWRIPPIRKSTLDSLDEADSRWEGEFHYAKYQNKYYLKYFVFHQTKEIYDTREKNKICDLEVYHEFITQEVNTGAPPEAAESNTLSDSDHHTLFRPVETALYRDILHDLDSLSKPVKRLD